jgi:hypothetical protein
MDKKEKLHLMEKMVRQLEDLVNSETAVVRKIGQMEAENINLNFKLLENQLPDILSKSEETLELATKLQEEFTGEKNRFITDNKLEEVID